MGKKGSLRKKLKGAFQFLFQYNENMLDNSIYFHYNKINLKKIIRIHYNEIISQTQLHKKN